jgi:hypothetical protein
MCVGSFITSDITAEICLLQNRFSGWGENQCMGEFFFISAWSFLGGTIKSGFEIQIQVMFMFILHLENCQKYSP